MKSSPLIKTVSLLALFIFLTSDINAELVLHWPFEEGSGTSTADLSGSNHEGTLTNMDPASDWISSGLADIPGGTSYALDFDGNNDFVNAATTSYKGITGRLARTVSAWIKTTADNPPIISWGNDVVSKKFVFRVQDSNGTNGAIRIEAAGGYIVGAKPVDDGTWHHVAAVCPADTSLKTSDVRLYVDGEIQGISAHQEVDINTDYGENVRVGTRWALPRYQGQIDEVRVYDHALTPAELNALAGANDPYAEAVNADAPEAWWRCGENIGARIVNEGSAMSYTDATASNKETSDRYQPSLVATSANRSLRIDGDDDRITIPNHASLNLGTFSNKTVETWFMPLEFIAGDEPRRIIFEQGGGSNGFNQYIWRDGDDYFFRCGAWITTSNYFPTKVPIETNEVYHAVSVLNESKRTFVGYINGACATAGRSTGITAVPQHTGGIGIGCINDDTKFDNGGYDGDGTNAFAGLVDEIATYNKALSFERIQEHYITGSGDKLGLRDGVTRGVQVNYDAANDIDGDNVFEDSIGSLEQGTAARNVFDWTLSGVERVAVVDQMAAITNAYRFDGSDTAKAESLRAIAGYAYLFKASVEMVFNPDDFIGNEVLLESGGATTGMSLALNGSKLRLYVRYSTSKNADVQFDLNELSAWRRNGFIHAVGVIDMDNNKIYLYVNGELKAEATANGNLVEWTGTDDAGLGCINAAAASPVSLSSFDGDIAIMRLYSSALTLDQIQANYQALEPPEFAPGTILMVQ